MARCRLVLTDSGGVQEEAPSLGKPVLVMRDTTERPEGVAACTAILTGPNASAIVEHAVRLLTNEAAYRSMATARNPYGDGHAAQQIVERIRRYFAAAETDPREDQSAPRKTVDAQGIEVQHNPLHARRRGVVARRQYRHQQYSEEDRHKEEERLYGTRFDASGGTDGVKVARVGDALPAHHRAR
jgi:hypothetical protein